MVKYNPLHPHCGPFNSVDKFPPKNKVDRICWKHDKAYGRMGSSAYYNYNEADELFIQRMDRQPGLVPAAYSSVFKSKRLLFPKKMPATPRRSKRKRVNSTPVTPPRSTKKNQRPPADTDLVLYQASPSSFPQNNSGMPARNARSRAARRRPRRNGRFAGRRAVRRRRPTVAYRKKVGKRVSRRSRRSYNQTSFKKKGRPVSYAKFGSVKTVEAGGVLTDPQCLYIGHAVAFAKLYEAIARACVRELFRLKGEHIVDWTNRWNMDADMTMNLHYHYGIPQATTLLLGGFTLTVDTTYEQVATALKAALISDLVAGNPYVIYDMWFSVVTDSDGTQVVASINLNQCSLNFFVKSKLKVQNGTLAAGTVDADDDQFTDIHRRPLLGKLYRSKRQLTGFIPNSRNRESAEASYTGFLASASTGLILAQNATSAIQQTRKPPAGYYFNANASGIRIEPGVIRTFTWSWNKKINFSTFMLKYPDYLSFTASAREPVTIGAAQMVGLEKELDTRSLENEISVGYQLDQTYCCALTKKIPKATALLEVQIP